MAAHVQESNKKYNELLTDKLNSEERLKKEFEEAQTKLVKEWRLKCEETAMHARKEEQEKAKTQLSKTIADYNCRIDKLD